MSLSSPAVSVIVPIYNVEKYLEQCVDSILAQTLHDIEVILVDDGSPDACPAMVDAYAAADPRVIAIHQPNGGYGKAVNAGIAAATAPYIGIVEPDDWIDTGMYEALYRRAQETGADIVKSAFYTELDTPAVKQSMKAPWADENVPKNCFSLRGFPCFMYWHPSIWSCLYRRDFLEQYKLKMSEIPGAGWTDNLFQVQSMCYASCISYVNEAWYHYRKTAENDSDLLHNYRIPFERSDEIHAWLEKTNIKDAGILLHLYMRELYYIRTVLGMKVLEDTADCYARIKAMCCRMQPDILKQAHTEKRIPRKLWQTYEAGLTSPAAIHRSIRFRAFRKRVKSTLTSLLHRA